jgi:tRNA dimethylallyltransferase
LAERKPLVPVIVGPTAVGKTALALALADLWPVTVVSADARQVYRGLDIGTAKPDTVARRKVPHVGIDLVDPGRRYSAGRFARDAAAWIDEILPARRPVVVGGTGFYVRALADGLFREPPMDAERRARLRDWSDTCPGLGAWAARLDTRYTGGGRQRAARAVEVALLTGRPLSWWQAQMRSEGAIRPWYLRLTVPRAVLHRRIRERVDAMIGAGLVDEVRGLRDRGIPPTAAGLDAVGYAEVSAHLDGLLSEWELPEAIATATRKYARRQETWFRHQLHGAPVVTLDASDGPEPLARRVVELWDIATGG